MEEARAAGRALARLRKERWSCDVCPYEQARRKGNRVRYEAHCHGGFCPLFATVELEHLALWLTFQRLIEWQRAGIHGLVGEVLGAMGPDLIDVFGEFKHALVTRLEAK